MAGHESGARAPDESRRRGQRRSFTHEYKQRIVKEAAACKKKGELGALLRREGLYASHLAAFRNATSRTGNGNSAAETRGRPRSVQVLVQQLAQKERELLRWRKRAERAEAMVRIQKKTFELTDIPPDSGMRSSISLRSSVG